MLEHIVTANLMEKDGRFFLVQEAQGTAKGLWNMPAGRLDHITTLHKNAVDEAREESGYTVKLNGLVGVYHTSSKEKHLVVFVFSSSIVGGKLDFQKDEIADAKWFTVPELKKMQKILRDRYILQAISDYKKRMLIPLEVISSIYV